MSKFTRGYSQRTVS